MESRPVIALCAYHKPMDGCIYLPRYTWRVKNKADKYGFSLLHYTRFFDELSFGVDILKMLNGEKDFVIER